MTDLNRHRKEILATLESHGVRQEDGILILNKMDLGFSGFQAIEVFEPLAVTKARLAGDSEWEAAERQLVSEMKAAGKQVLMGKIQDVRGTNTWFNEGITRLFNVFFKGTAAQTSHYFLIGDQNNVPAATWQSASGGPGVQVSSASGLGNFVTYTSGTRVAVPFDAAASQSITNSVAANVVCDTGASGTLYGAAIMSSNLKNASGDDSGYAIAAKQFSPAIAAAVNNEINIKHTLSGAAS